MQPLRILKFTLEEQISFWTLNLVHILTEILITESLGGL